MPRQQVGDLRRPAELAPVAAPVDTYYRPNLAGPELQALVDFSPLSESLRGLQQEMAAGERERKIEKGIQFATNNPDLVKEVNEAQLAAKTPEEARKSTQAAFQKLIAEGKLDEAASPLFQIGFSQASARTVMGAYRDAVFARMAEATTIVDGENGLPAEPADPQAIMAEEFEKLAGNVALRNHYGAQTAAELRQQIDDEFTGKVAAERTSAVRERHRTLLRNDMTQRIGAWTNLAQVTDEDRAQLTEFISKEVHAKNVSDPRGLALEAFEAAFAQAADKRAGGDAETAIRLIEDAEELQIGGVKLGEDASASLRLKELKRQYERQKDQDEDEEYRGRDRKKQAAIDKAQRELLPVLLEEHEKGGSVERAYDLLREKIAGDTEFGEYGGVAAEWLRDYKNTLQNTKSSDRSVTDAVDVMLARRDTKGARAMLDAALYDDATAISGRDYATYLEKIREAEDIAPEMEQTTIYQDYRSRIAQGRRLQGFPAEVQAKHDEFYDSLVQQFDEEVEEVVRATRGQPNANAARRAFVRERGQKVMEAMRLRETEIRAKQTQFDSELAKLNRQRLPADDLIAAYQGDLTAEQVAAARAMNDEAQSRKDLFEAPESRRVLDSIDRAVANSGLEGFDADSLRSLLTDKFYTAANNRLDEVLPNTPPAQLPHRWRGILSELDKEMQSAAGSEIKDAAKRVSKGEEPLKAIEGQQERNLDRDNSDAFAKALRSGQGVTKNSTFLPRNPHVSPSFYEMYADHVSGHWTLSRFGKVPRDEVVNKAAIETGRILSDANLSPKEQGEAVAAMYSMVGMKPEFLLADEITVERPASVREKAERELKWYQNAIELGGLSSSYHKEAARLRELITPKKVPIKGVKFNPYTTPVFESETQLNFMAQREPAKWKAILARIGIDAENPDQEREFVKHQLDAIARVRTDA